MVVVIIVIIVILSIIITRVTLMVCILQEQMTVEMVSALVAVSNLMLQKVVLPRLACVASCKCNEQHVFFSCGSSCFQKLWLYRQERKINSLARFRNFHVLPL